MRSRSLRAVVLAPLLGLACSQPPDLSADIEEYANNIDDAISLTCDCPVDAGFADMAECSEMLGGAGSAERQCMADALTGYENEGKDFLECANSAYSSYLSCLEFNASSCNEGGVALCSDAHEQAISACPQLSATAKASFDACAP